MRHVIAVVVALAASSCKTDKTPPPRLITEPEIAAHKQALLARLAANQTRRCERPLLRGTPLPGPAAPDVLALVEPPANSPLAGCLAKPEPAPDAVATCGPLVEASLVKAVSHVDACSPYQAGVRTTAFERTPHIRLAKLVAATAAERAKTDPTGALWLVLDAIRLSDDLARGHTSLLDDMLGVAATKILVERAVAIVPTVPTDALPAFEKALDTLIASPPSMTETFRGEHDTMALFYALAPLEPEGWVPPGGWGDNKRPAAPNDATDPMDPRDGHAIMFLVAERQAAAIERVCPPDVTLEMCSIGLAGLPTGHEAASVEKLYKELASANNSNDVRIRIRDAIADVLERVARPSLADYVKKRGRALASLAALRVHLSLARACTFDPALLAPKQLGDKLVAKQIDMRIELTPPRWIGGDALPAFTCK